MANSHLQIDNIELQLSQRLTEVKKDKTALLKSRAIVERALQEDNALYGINTGFGALAHKTINAEQLSKLQKNFLYSHAVGVGEMIPKDICRLMLLLKIHSLSLGYSGISEEVFDRLVLFAEKNLIPAAPSKGSLGASGDLAPLSHMSLPLLGKGFFWDEAGKEIVDAAAILKKHKLKAVALQAKDGLSLCNGTQMMSAYGTYVLSRCSALIKSADILGGMGLEALRGSSQPFDEKIHAARPYSGQRDVSANIRRLLSDSEIMDSHKDCNKVQDPYSLRCIPQVHGASRDALNYVKSVVETEINSATDNPLVFQDGDILSGGNFHGQPLALAFDFAAIALAELASISERRIYLLLKGLDGLPALLMEDTGVNSGFMITQYTAAALVSENKVLCHPASVDSIPTSLGQEDHVSMGSIAAVKLLTVLQNVEQVLSIEAFTASQALDFRKGLRAGRGIDAAYRYIRKYVPHRKSDELYSEDINSCAELIRRGGIVEAAEKVIGELE